MDDSTDMIDPTGPSDHTDLERRLAAHFDAAMTEVDDTTPPLDEVCRRGRRLCRRRRATQMVGALGVIGALVLAVSVATGTLGGDGDELTVGPTADSPAIDRDDTNASEDSDEVADGDPAGAEDGAPPSRPTPTGSVVARPAPAGWVGEQIAHDLWSQQLLPWGDGVARMTTEWDEPLLEPMSDEMVALFPVEVREFFADGLPATVDEGYRMLLDRPELLAQVQQVIDEHPEVADHLYGRSGPSTLIVETSPDARTWTNAGELEVPGLNGWLQFAMSAGDRIVAVIVSWPDDTDSVPEHIVASTTDLATWDTIEWLDPPDTGPPPAGFRRDRWFQHADLSPDGSLAVLLNDSLELDLESLLPPDLLARTEWGYGMFTDDEGVVLSLPSAEEIERLSSTLPAWPDDEWDDAEWDGECSVSTAASSACHWIQPDDEWPDAHWDDEWFEEGPAFEEEILLTWDELGIDPALVREVEGGGRTLLWVGRPGSLRPMTPPPSTGWLSGLVAMPGGGVVITGTDHAGTIDLWYAPDGSTWEDRRPLMTGPNWFTSISRAADGIVLAANGQDGLRWWRADEAVTEWVESAPIELDGVDPDSRVSLDQSWTAFRPGVGHVVALRLEPTLFVGWSVEVDGFRFEASPDPWGFGRLVRIGTDGAPDEILLELSPFVDDEFVLYTSRGITLLDPETGEELVSIDNQTLEAAFEEAFGNEAGNGDPGGLLVVLIDPEGTGETWYELDRFPAGETWLAQIVLTDGLVLLSLEGADGPVLHTYGPS